MFLKFGKFQPRCSYKIYCYRKKKESVHGYAVISRNALRTRNSYMSYLSGVGYTATQLHMLLRKLEPVLSPFDFVCLAAM